MLDLAVHLIYPRILGSQHMTVKADLCRGRLPRHKAIPRALAPPREADEAHYVAVRIDVTELQRRLEDQGAFLGRTAPETVL
jgi:hypothetical protein